MIPPPHNPDSSDWRFSVIILGVLVLAGLITALVLYVQDGTVVEGLGNFIAALTGALILLIGKQVRRD